MNPRDPSIELASREHRVTRVLRERWYVVALIAGVCLVGALAISLSSPKEYQATSRLLFQQDSFGAALFGNNVFQSSTDPARTAGTNVDEVNSPAVAGQVKRNLNLSQSPQDLLDSTTVSSEANADIVDISVQSTSPSQAAAIANAWGNAFVAQRQQQDRGRIGQAIADMQAKINALPATDSSRRSEYQQQIAKLESLQAVQFGNVQVLDTASVPTAAVSPKPTRDGAVGLLLGLVIGAGIAVLLDALDRRIKSVDALEAAYDLPVIGLVPSRAFKPRTDVERRRSIEAFRAVREGLSVFAVNAPSPVFLVTSAVSGEGKTTVAVNLARVLAISGDRVMLIEADLRRPSLAAHVGTRPPREGLTSALLHDVPLSEVVIRDRTGLENLQIVPSGQTVPFAAELLRSPKMERVLQEARELSDVVIVDAPPLLPVADARSLIKLAAVDGVLLVSRLYTETTDQAKRVRALLEQHGIQEVRLIATGTAEESDYGYDDEYAGTPAAPAPTARPAAPRASRPTFEARQTRGPAPAPTGSPASGPAAPQTPTPATPPASKLSVVPSVGRQPFRPIASPPTNHATEPPVEPAPTQAAGGANGAAAKPRRPFSPTQG